MAPAPPPTAILRLSRAGEQGAGSRPPGAERWECCQGPLGVSAQRQRAWSSRMLSLKEKDGLCVCVCVCVCLNKLILFYFIYFWLCCIFVAALAFFSSCRAQASHCSGLSCCGASAVGHVGFSSCGSRALECRLSSCGP